MPATADARKAADTVSESEALTVVSGGAPLIVDIGKKRKKQIKQLRQGRGKLIDEINGLLDDLRTAGSISASAQPVVIVVQEKRKRNPMMWPLA